MQDPEPTPTNYDAYGAASTDEMITDTSAFIGRDADTSVSSTAS